MAAVIKIEINSASGGKGIDDATKSLKDLEGTAQKSGGGISAFGQMAIGAFREIGAVAVQALGSAAQAVGGFAKDAISAAGNFEAGMNSFAAASGLGGAELESFKDQFIQLGKELPVSTKEVQDAAIALVKGGIDPAIVKGGALRDTLLFAAAAGMGLEESADLTTKQLGTFVDIAATAAEKTEFMAHSQELLVKAANASTLNVKQLGDAMLAAGGQVKAIGMSYDDFVTTMGLISPSFGSAAEAGTSFKNLLARLIPTTKNAKDAMAELGLTTKDGGNVFFDSTGKFLGAKNAAEQLQKAMAGLSDKEKMHYLQTMFGNDAMGAANALISAGGAGYEEFAKKMFEANGIQGTATTTQQGLNFAMENFKGSVEALQIILGTKLLPLLTPLVSMFTGWLNVIISFTETFLKLGPALLESTNPIATFFNILRIGTDDSLNPMLNAIQRFITSIWTLAQAIVGMPTTMGGMITAMKTLADQFGVSFETVAAVVSALQGVRSTIFTVVGVIQANLPVALAVAQQVFTSIGAIVQERMNTVQAVIAAVLPIITAFWAENGASIMATVQIVFTKIVEIITSASGIINQLMLIIAGFMAAHGTQIVGYLTAAWNMISGIIITALDLVSGIVRAALQLLKGDFSGAWQTIQATSATFVLNLVNIFTNLGSLLMASVNLTISAIKDAFGGLATEAVTIGKNIIDGIISGITSSAGSLANAAASAAQDALKAAKSALGIESPSKVFADQVGMPIAQGMARGMTDNAGLVAGAAQGLAGGALQTASHTVNNHYNYSPNYSSTPNKPSQDFALMRSLATAGT